MFFVFFPSAILKKRVIVIHVFEMMNICQFWLVKIGDLTFIMSACQMIGPGSVMYVCLSVDAVQVLSPGVWAQGSEKLFDSVKGGYGPVQVLQ